MWSILKIKAEARDFIQKNYLIALGVAVCMVTLGMYNIEKFFDLRYDEFKTFAASEYDEFMNGDIRNLLLTKEQREEIEKIRRNSEEVYRDSSVVIIETDFIEKNQISSVFLNTPWSRPFNFFVMKTLFPLELRERVSTVLIILFWVLLFKIFVANPILCGGYVFFLRGAEGDVDFVNLWSSFREGNYFHIVKTMFLKDFIIFWCMVPAFVVVAIFRFLLPFVAAELPNFSFDINDKISLILMSVGIVFILVCLLFLSLPLIKLYELSMTPFILEDEQDLTVSETLRRSRELTKGHKLKIFLMDLSFVFWYLLGNFFFLIGRVLMQPYYLSAKAHLFIALTEMDEEY
ncbi:MAG: DUF975 family protein [Peptostreptococcaceae bacterium]|nr:DUF975 family protein [Peptostreptococcaceae bacterium]